MTHHHVDNSPIQAIVVAIQTAGIQNGPLSDRTAGLDHGLEPMTESWSLVILTDRRRPSLTLLPASPHGPPESRLLHPEKAFGNWGNNPCQHYTSRKGEEGHPLKGLIDYN